MRQLPTAAEAAILIALAVKRKEADSGKELLRARLTEVTLRKYIGRRRIDGRFIEDLNEALGRFDLHLVFTDAIGLMKASSVKGWPRMTAQWAAEEIKAARKGRLNYDQIEAELDGDVDDEDDEEDSQS